MTNNTSTAAVSYTEVSHTVRAEAAAHSTDYLTAVIVRQDWAGTAENGIYAGKSYRRTERYISNVPGHRGQLISTSSEPWA